MYTIVNDNIIFNLQFGFGEQSSTSYVLINITDNIRKGFDDGNVGCEGFFILTKSFWYCRPPDTDSKIESLWDSWSSK